MIWGRVSIVRVGVGIRGRWGDRGSGEFREGRVDF